VTREVQDPPRYSSMPLPAYRHVPGRTPHPRRDAGGHGHDAPEPVSESWDPAGWREIDLWLHAVDLFNLEYWWECHEALEALWRAADREDPGWQFVQGLVLVAAAYLNRLRGKPNVRRQAERGLVRMESAGGARFMGIDVAAFASAVRADFAGDGKPARIRLEIGA
jgi:hypothetical protein